MIHYIKGNLFDCVNQNTEAKIIIPHVVNNIGAWGAGFVLSIDKYFPEAKTKYRNMIGSYLLGEVIWDHYDNGILANMVAQDNVFSKNNKKPIKYTALVKCMHVIANYTYSGRLGNPDYVEIHAPKFGSGLAGGNWDFIEELIEEIWGEFKVFVYYL